VPGEHRFRKTCIRHKIADTFSAIAATELHSLHQYLAFAGTARHGSFAAAARELGVAPSTLAKAVSRLESTLAVRLFHRTTRQVQLTPDGERLFRRCERVLAEIDELQADAAGTRAAPQGTLKIDLPVTYGKRFVLPLLARLQAQHPGLALDIRLSDRIGDLVRDATDLAVRIGRLDDSTLIAKRIDQQELVLVASPAYLAARGTPRRIEDLSGHAAIVFRLPSSGRDRPWQLRQRGQPVELAPRPALRIGETEGLAEAALLGCGLVQLPDYVVERELADGRLVELLPSLRTEAMPIHLVHPAGRLVPARVRVAIEALEGLRQRRPRKARP
jgi:DNA-binding transcriptional LysR family regulator